MNVNTGKAPPSMSEIREGLAAYRNRELYTPTVAVLNSRVPLPYYRKVQSEALRLKTTPSTLFRFLAAEGAKQFGIDLLSVV